MLNQKSKEVKLKAKPAPKQQVTTVLNTDRDDYFGKINKEEVDNYSYLKIINERQIEQTPDTTMQGVKIQFDEYVSASSLNQTSQGNVREYLNRPTAKSRQETKNKKIQEILSSRDEFEINNCNSSANAQHKSDSSRSRLLESRQTSKFFDNQSHYNTSF